MAREINLGLEFDEYVAALEEGARHHAPHIRAIIRPLSDVVREAIETDVDNIIKVYERNGQIARTCWVTIRGRRFCFSYNYEERMIDLRDRSTQGEVLLQLSGNWSDADLRRVTEMLIREKTLGS